jgi:hypothetical protein
MASLTEKFCPVSESLLGGLICQFLQALRPLSEQSHLRPGLCSPCTAIAGLIFKSWPYQSQRPALSTTYRGSEAEWDLTSSL